MNRSCFKKTATIAAIACAFATGAFYQNSMELSPVSHAVAQQASKKAELPDFTKLVEENGKAVVSIKVSKKGGPANFHGNLKGLPKDKLDELRRFGFPFPDFDNDKPMPMPKRHGQGSGFIISPDGMILTNHHVVEGADEIKVHLSDDRELPAKVIGSDSKTDVAVIKIDAKNLPTVRLGKSSKVKVGEWVAAIGAPFGLENTVTSGIVSAKSRDLPSDQFVPFIQTDAAVNPGNSGGPLFNMDGEVIGINSQIFSTSGGFMGLSFAIPIDLALQIKDDLVQHGRVHRGRLGVMIQSMSPELAQGLGLSNSKGALIAQVEKDSAAEKAGLVDGDIVIEFAGKPVTSSSDLSRAVASAKPGSEQTMKIVREGKEKTLKVTLSEAPNEDISSAAQEQAKGRLGVSVRPLNAEEKKQYKDGLVILEAEGAAAAAGLKAGDILIGVGGKKISSFEQFKKAVDDAKSILALQIIRDGQRSFVAVKLDQDKKEAKSAK